MDSSSSNGASFDASSFFFTYATSQSPSITSISPANGVKGDTLTITGSGFGENGRITEQY